MQQWLRELSSESKDKVVREITMQQELVVIVGGGPSGLATAACLTKAGIANIVLEKEECHASLWKKRTYDCLNLHLGKAFCELPMKPHDPSTPRFMSKETFINYLDDYVSEFKIKLHYSCGVNSAVYDEITENWMVEAENTKTGERVVYLADFLVVATGENGEPFVPDLPGLQSFKGEVLHSKDYKCGGDFQGKHVLVVGAGNSGMEISKDLACFGAYPSLVVRSPVHVLDKHLVYWGMLLLSFLPVTFVDILISMMAFILYGNLSKHGIRRPNRGPFYLKQAKGRSPVLDVGAVSKIKAGLIKICPKILEIDGNLVKFEDGVEKQFDAIVFATGYRTGINKWLKDYEHALNSDGLPKEKFPNHWKGEKQLYVAGLSRRGIAGCAMDAKAIALDIFVTLFPGEKLPEFD